jgi:hypothetical protein
MSESVNEHNSRPTGPAGDVSTARMFFSAFLPGNLTTAYTAAKVIPDNAITVTRITSSLKTPAGTGCAPAVVRLSDGATGQDITLGSQSSVDSGPVALLFNAGNPLNVQVQMPAICGTATNPADANVEVQYKMRDTADIETCAGSGILCGAGICETLTSNF